MRLQHLTKADFLALAKLHPRIVVYEEMLADRLTPIGTFERLRGVGPHPILLESYAAEARDGRFSYIGIHPISSVIVRAGKAYIEEADGHRRDLAGDPLAAVRDYHKRCRAEMSHPIRGFSGGVAGFVTYDAVHLCEKVSDTPPQTTLPALVLRAYQDHIAFDHQHGTCILSTVIDVEDESSYDVAIERLAALKAQVIAPFEPPPVSGTVSQTVTETLSDAEFIQRVQQAQHHLHIGDIFQVVLSRAFKVQCTIDPFEAYRTIRHINPSPYLFYVEADNNTTMVGASPEKLVSVEGRTVEVRPIAGTRRRGTISDAELIQDLQNDPKERAEHVMLVDLGRNDVGKVSVPGSVQVSEFAKPEVFSHVIHLTSTVQGTLRPELDAFDALWSAFPAGTLSGAPKIRAMQIIHTLEPTQRGLYGGAVIMVDGYGNLNSCIAIRMATFENGEATVQAGAGIVLDSDPAAEANETRAKAAAMLRALQAVGETMV
ncbi:MAG: hypothetical protein A3J38_08095 [Gammaproteobacteria bacterium RIFCSPHIGHO2_12_FULL_45_9]|nr:MAG: hypothetical protein A3J38_08095 [Gammaproteobacteria bacterium RIFCSPHIGHO2_12_FULL_45_9]